MIKYTHVKLLNEYWDDEKKEIKRSHPESKLLNPMLKKQFSDLQSELLLADEATNKFGNAWVYEATVNALKGFHPKDNITF